MHRVLIVSPNFPPINSPDHQRVRMALPYFEENGWRATVLACRPGVVEGATSDPFLERTVPVGTEVLRTGAVPVKWTRRVGLGSLALRALPHLNWTGSRLLRGNKFDLVFFSTTSFPTFTLGPWWRRRFGVPYVVDFQDPWLDDYYRRPGAPPPPGGRWRHRFNHWLAQLLEPRVMRDVAQVISVSPGYVETLLGRYPFLESERFTELPFGGPERDFETLPTLGVRQDVFDPADGRQHWVYVGRGGQDMAPALRVLFGALAAARRREPSQWSNVRLHFVGTSYAPAGRAKETVMPVARECGVEDLVEERTGRVPYFTALRLLTQSAGILIIGSDTPAYSASKLYPCMLAGRPLLAVLHADSPAVAILQRCGGGRVVTFRPSREDDDAQVATTAPPIPDEREAATRALEAMWQEAARGEPARWNRAELSGFSARTMTRRLCAVFDRALLAHGEAAG